LIAITLSCVYIGSYLATRDSVVAFHQETTYNGSLVRIRVIPVYRSELRYQGKQFPIEIPKAALGMEPTYIIAAPLLRIIFTPAVRVEQFFAERFGAKIDHERPCAGL
jgi:hypothetical protein